MRVLFMAAEAAPYAKVGGLGDVAGALPPAMAALGHEVWLLVPRHPSVAHAGVDLRPAIPPFQVDFDWAPRWVNLLTAALPNGVTLATLANQDYFQRPRVYGEPDDVQRYLFFSKLGLEAIRRVGWRPDVLHAHDWHTAAAINWVAVAGRGDPLYGEVGTVLTIHNLAYQGFADQGVIGLLGVEAGGVLALEWERFGGVVNLLARGLTYADIITTVSPTYAREILTPANGEGLEGLLQQRSDRLRGILNGIDRALFDPATDPHLAATFDVHHLAARAANKRALQRRAGLPSDDTPLIGIVARLTDQKGFDLLAQALDPLLALGPNLVVLGTGQPYYEDFWRAAAQRYPDRVATWLTFDPALAQLIYGGADLFLMPSRFEPGGLGQLFAMRYGSLPIVRATGGLADTVHDADADPAAGDGFVFDAYTPEALLDAVGRALIAYRQPSRWSDLIRRAMGREFSWHQSCLAYDDAYRSARQLARTRA